MLAHLVLIAAKDSSKVNFRIVFITNYHHSTSKTLKSNKHKYNRSYIKKMLRSFDAAEHFGLTVMPII